MAQLDYTKPCTEEGGRLHNIAPVSLMIQLDGRSVWSVTGGLPPTLEVGPLYQQKPQPITLACADCGFTYRVLRARLETQTQLKFICEAEADNVWMTATLPAKEAP